MAGNRHNRMTLPVERAYRYEGRSLDYYLPLEIGCFSKDAKDNYCDDDRQVKYLCMPSRRTGLSMDLNEGFDDYIYREKDKQKEYDGILHWILLHQDIIRNHFLKPSSTRPEIDFILYRGVLTSISSTIYERLADWMLYATKFKSVIYLRDIWTERKAEAEESSTERQTRMMTWGHKFEQCMVSDSVSSRPDTSVPVNENESYFAVFKGRLGHHRLLFSAEIDGVDPKKLASGCDSTSPERYVELKTCRILTDDKQERNFKRYKLLKWYLQSYFAGIPKVICGFRNDQGIVQALKVFYVRDMPEMVDGLWSPDACLNFTSSFLDFVKERVVRDKAVYKFYWQPGSDIICEELDPEFAFIPEWYRRKVRVI